MISLFLFIGLIIIMMVVSYTDQQGREDFPEATFLSMLLPVIVILFIWLSIGIYYVSEDHKMYNIPTAEITDVQPLTEGHVVNRNVLYLDADKNLVFTHKINSNEYELLTDWHIVYQIQNIHAETSRHEVVRFNVPRGRWFRWWRYDDRWVVRITRR